LQRSTQSEKIENYLWERFGQWVPLPEILPLAAQYSARICELRRKLKSKGYEIQNKTERQPDGSLHSWFRVCEIRAIDVTPPAPAPAPAPITNGDWYEARYGQRPSHKSELRAALPLFTVHQ
jgi:hypothetical protein